MEKKIRYCLYGVIISILINKYISFQFYIIFSIILGVFFMLKNERKIFYLTIGALLFSIPLVLYGIEDKPFETGTRLNINGEITKVYEKFEDFQRIEVDTNYGKFSIGVNNDKEYKLYDRVNGNIEIIDINTYKNFGMNNMYDYYYQNYILNNAISNDLERIETTSLIKKLKLNIKNNIENSIDKNNSEETAGILRKLILSDSSRLDRDLNDLYSRAGVSHLFAISGLHILIIIFLLENLFLKLGVSFRTRFYIIFLSVLFYAFIIDFPPSINRALLMYAIKKVTDMREIKISNIGVISLSALILLIINPRYLFNIGFILSFGSVLGINILSKRIPIRGDIIKDSLNMYLSVNIFIFPFLVLYFNNFNILSFISNFFMTYIVMINLIISFISIFIDNLFGISILYKFIDISFQMANFYIDNFLKYFYFPLRILNPSIIFVILYFIFLYIILSKKYHNIIYKVRYSIYLSTAFIAFIFLFNSLNPPLIMGFYDVGQGDSSYIIYKDKYIQIDTGGSPGSSFNPGVEVTAKAIEKRGINKIDLMILTHFDYDHSSGVPTLIDRNYIDYIVAGFNDEENEIYKYIKSSDAKLLYPRDKQVIDIDKDFSLKFLNINDNFEKGNESSLVTLINYKDKKILLTGDIGFEAENLIADDIGKVDILKVAHHGSKYSSGIDFLNKIRPKYSVISVGKNNYGHPTNETLTNLKIVGSKVLRTDKDGEIRFIINKNINYETYYNRGMRYNLDNYFLFGIIFLMLIYYVKYYGNLNEI